MHLEVYATTGAGAIVHTHSPAAAASSAVVDELPPVHYGIVQLGGDTMRIASYERSGLDARAHSTAAAIEGRQAAIPRTIAGGDTVAAAFGRARLLEWLCEVYWRTTLIGKPNILTDEELEAAVAEARSRCCGTVPS